MRVFILAETGGEKRLISGKEPQPLLAEANELIKIVAKSVITAKRGGK